MTQWEQDIAQQKASIQRLEAGMARLNALEDDLKDERQKVERLTREFAAELGSRDATIRQEQKRVAQLTTDRDKLSERVKELIGELSRAKDAQNLDHKVSSRVDKQHNEELQRHIIASGNLKRQLDQAEGEMASLRKRVEAMTAERQGVYNDLTTARNALEELRTAKDAEIAAVSARARDDHETAAQANNRATAAHTTLESERQRHRAYLDEREASLQSAQSSFAERERALTARLETSGNELVHAQARIRDLDASLSQVSGALTGEKAAHEATRRQLREALEQKPAPGQQKVLELNGLLAAERSDRVRDRQNATEREAKLKQQIADLKQKLIEEQRVTESVRRSR